MKKVFGILMVILVVLIGLVACSNDKEEYIEPNIKNEDMQKFDYVEDNNIDKYKIVQTIELPELEEEGYTWKYEILEPSIVVSVNDEYVAENEVRKFSFQGIREGSSEIIFTKKAENDGTSLKETLRYVFSVNTNKEIAITNQLERKLN